MINLYKKKFSFTNIWYCLKFFFIKIFGNENDNCFNFSFDSRLYHKTAQRKKIWYKFGMKFYYFHLYLILRKTSQFWVLEWMRLCLWYKNLSKGRTTKRPFLYSSICSKVWVCESTSKKNTRWKMRFIT